jgi:2-(1,2-epoxy-1,2-dihydrophenyl)acetyl-CoA isomerase
VTDQPTPALQTAGASADAPVVVRTGQGVLEIVLNRPRARNAVGLAEAQAFLGAVSRIEDPTIGCVLLRAEGEHFCVGGDLRDFAASDDVRDRVLRTASAAHAAILLLAQAPVPVVTAVQGWAAGIGVSLAALGDVVLAGDGAQFRSAYTAIGFTPDGGLSHLLPRLVGQARAGDFVFTNRALSAGEAACWGLVSRVVPDTQLQDAARTLARELAAGPRQAHRVVRGLLRSGGIDELRAALDAEAAAISAQAADPEGREGLAAFLERRTPDFPSAEQPGAVPGRR